MPTEILKKYSKLYPQAWKCLEEMFFRQSRELPVWPQYVFVPVAGAYSVVSQGMPYVSPKRGVDIAAIAALGAWRLTQSIYRFHPVIFNELSRTEIKGELPVEVLHRLPEWCVYVETPPFLCHGFWAHLEWDVNTGEEELRFLFHLPEGELFPLQIHLVGTLAEGLERSFEFTKQFLDKQFLGHEFDLQKIAESFPIKTEYVEGILSNLEVFISLILYLCSAEPEFIAKSKLSNPKPKKTKKGVRLFPAPGPNMVKVGYALGEKLRYMQSESVQRADRKSPRPHIRRGHWHHYWVGSRKNKEERKLILKWIHPLLVGAL